jgi:hypothetical protein
LSERVSKFRVSCRVTACNFKGYRFVAERRTKKKRRFADSGIIWFGNQLNARSESMDICNGKIIGLI